MSPEKMVRMANQIATFFESQPDADKPARVAAHLKEFWEPRMLDQLADHLKTGASDLTDLARQGAERVIAERT